MAFLAASSMAGLSDLGSRVLPFDSDTPDSPTGMASHARPFAGNGIVFRSEEATLIARCHHYHEPGPRRWPWPSRNGAVAATDAVHLRLDRGAQFDPSIGRLMPLTLAAGHGTPMAGEKAFRQLENLAWHFPMPSHGRYVNEPALTDDSGNRDAPPPAPDASHNRNRPRLAAVTAAMVAIAARAANTGAHLRLNSAMILKLALAIDSVGR